MGDEKDIELLFKSHIPIVVIETHEESRAVAVIRRVGMRVYKPIFKWSVTDGLQRIDMDYEPQRLNSEPDAVLKHIKSVAQPGIYCLSDFHPYLADPMNVRLLKDIALEADASGITLVLVSHQIELPAEVAKYSAITKLSLPDKRDLKGIISKVADEWAQKNRGKRVKADPKSLDMLINNLSGLTAKDAKRLARNAIYNDGAITQNDIQRIMKAKYELLSKGGVLSFEYDTAKFSDIGGFSRLKKWLQQRLAILHEPDPLLDKPKGVLLLGVQGCGKSMAAKAVAGIMATPLLRLDFGTLYNKYHGETERNLRESLHTASAMSPCVLWIDEIEKGLSIADSDGGTSNRVLGTILTWLAEKKELVFVVATANDIEKLPPELIRKGRFDEIFFVDLPTAQIRKEILSIHLQKRGADPASVNVPDLVNLTEGFSGAEIEQAVVSAIYTARARKKPVDFSILADEIQLTKPISITMKEKVAYLRSWAKERTVFCD